MRVTQGLAESCQIAIHRGFAYGRSFSVTSSARLFQSPSFETFDVSLIDLIKTEISPRTVVEQLPIAFLIKFDRPILLRFGMVGYARRNFMVPIPRAAVGRS